MMHLAPAPYAVSIYPIWQLPHERAFAAASKMSGIPVADLRGTNAKREVARVRWAVFRALRRSGRTLGAVGRICRRDHSTVQHGLVRAAELYATDPAFAKLCDAVERALV